MAKKVTVTLVDDVDDTKTADETVEFGVDGVTYEIDLSSSNADKLRKDLAKWVEHGRRVGGRKRGKSLGSRASVDREQTAVVRDWGKKNGYEVSARGRISQEVMDAYNAAH
ncbi:histone-like nucleoid-structuring protein Lsr2 [Jongsikchunia kroppenstedtii]|uniref:histone-like nucleoid-structuring protein Lsr2 n=1 Tax=Jongsikchunia kroppenstedtii TaxID=1121721 RepID=UPI00036F6E1D|nr:Lsr2 family protein [Jongsikchunia kroppenstedtii]